MKFVSVRDFRLKSGEVWKAAKQEKDIVVTSSGRPKDQNSILTLIRFKLLSSLFAKSV